MRQRRRPRKAIRPIKGIAELLSRYAADSLEERKRLLRHLFVNTVLGNTDAHAKNYALLHGGDEVPLRRSMTSCQPLRLRRTCCSWACASMVAFASIGSSERIL